MLRTLTAIGLLAFTGAAVACDDAGRGKSMTYQDDGVPTQTVAQPAKASEKDATATASPQKVKSEQPAAKRRAPKGKPLPT
jgi:hypothetical protein